VSQQRLVVIAGHEPVSKYLYSYYSLVDARNPLFETVRSSARVILKAMLDHGCLSSLPSPAGEAPGVGLVVMVASAGVFVSFS